MNACETTRENHGTEILVYSKVLNDTETELHAFLQTLIPGKTVPIYRTIEGLSSRFSTPLGETAIGVFLVSDAEDLRNIISIQPMLSNIKIILILPDRDRQTITEAHNLHPRFLDYRDSDLSNVRSVLAKMIETESAMSNTVNLKDSVC